MPIWQLCANLLIPNCLRSNLSYSPLAALELYVKKYNPLTFSGIKHVDPEHTSQNNGYIYPINTTYNLGIQLKFR